MLKILALVVCGLVLLGTVFLVDLILYWIGYYSENEYDWIADCIYKKIREENEDE